MPVRRRYLFVCINRRPDDNPKGSCAAKGSVAVHDALKQQLFERNLAKVEARACTASCLDQCATGVSILVEPDHFFYGRVTVEDVPEIVEALAGGSRVERSFSARRTKARLRPCAPVRQVGERTGRSDRRHARRRGPHVEKGDHRCNASFLRRR